MKNIKYIKTMEKFMILICISWFWIDVQIVSRKNDKLLLNSIPSPVRGLQDHRDWDKNKEIHVVFGGAVLLQGTGRGWYLAIYILIYVQVSFI